MVIFRTVCSDPCKTVYGGVFPPLNIWVHLGNSLSSLNHLFDSASLGSLSIHLIINSPLYVLLFSPQNVLILQNGVPCFF